MVNIENEFIENERSDNMNFEKLEKNIIDLIEEQQLKLGYLKETVRLYYPLSSLNNFLVSDCDVDRMKAVLDEFSEETKEKLGGIKITNSGERFCMAIPPKGAEYVHNNLNENGFLAQLINVVRDHGSTFDQVLDVFKQNSNKVHVEQMSNGEFDYLVYFEDDKPDDFRYCISVETHHVTYHRYTPADYKEFGF